MNGIRGEGLCRRMQPMTCNRGVHTDEIYINDIIFTGSLELCDTSISRDAIETNNSSLPCDIMNRICSLISRLVTCDQNLLLSYRGIRVCGSDCIQELPVFFKFLQCLENGILLHSCSFYVCRFPCRVRSFNNGNIFRLA